MGSPRLFLVGLYSRSVATSNRQRRPRFGACGLGPSLLAPVWLGVLLLAVGASPALGAQREVSSAGAAVVGSELGRPEEGEVFRLYRSVLGRSPDGEGFDYWVAARVEGLTLRAIADGFLNSSEYARRFGAGSDPEFLGRVYGNVLGRPGEQAGVDYWLELLAGGLQRTELVLLFSESLEHRNRTGTASAVLPDYRPMIGAVVESEVALSWRTGCPVSPSNLRAVEVDHVDFDGAHRRGTLVVNADVAEDIATIFGVLYRAGYPIASIRPVDEFGADDDASMEANNTSAFNCRSVTGGSAWSRHSFGRAIDINPIQNPYVSGDVVLPPTGSDFLDRSSYHPAMIRPGDVVTSAFADAGWRWGGNFRSLRDYQHFDR